MYTTTTAAYAAPPSTNGTPDKSRVESTLIDEPLTRGYQPTLPLWSLFGGDTGNLIPQFYLLRDIELMMIHPVVLSALGYYKAGLAGAEFEITADSPEVQLFATEQCKRYWDRGVPALQGGYEYGWIGCEACYKNDDNLLRWDSFMQFSPRDVFLLTCERIPVGIRVKNVQPGGSDKLTPVAGAVDLWSASGEIPAKGVWYTHNPRYSRFYGQSQLLGAWRPWRRLAWKDGAEMVIDGGVYRFAYAGPQIKYPEEDLQTAQMGVPGTALDSQGRPRRYARDVARQLGEWIKTGASVGIPSTNYPPEMGGGPKWAVEWPKGVLNVDPLINYAKWLQDQIKYGVGVPPELLEAAETGSGYSGRVIPLEGFLAVQQHLADALLELFLQQVLRPLVRWNFGDVKWDAKVRNLLETKRQAQSGKGVQTPPQQGQLPGGDQGMGSRDIGGWERYTGDRGGQGWRNSRSGNVQYGAVPPGGVQEGPGILSMNSQLLVTDRVREIARRVLQRVA